MPSMEIQRVYNTVQTTDYTQNLITLGQKTSKENVKIEEKKSQQSSEKKLFGWTRTRKMWERRKKQLIIKADQPARVEAALWYDH